MTVFVRIVAAPPLTATHTLTLYHKYIYQISHQPDRSFIRQIKKLSQFRLQPIFTSSYIYVLEQLILYALLNKARHRPRWNFAGKKGSTVPSVPKKMHEKLLTIRLFQSGPNNSLIVPDTGSFHLIYTWPHYTISLSLQNICLATNFYYADKSADHIPHCFVNEILNDYTFYVVSSCKYPSTNTNKVERGNQNVAFMNTTLT